jgi:hypothetical protein
VNKEAQELLRKAADYMAEHGHTKGAFVDEGTGRVCADGAIQAAGDWVSINGISVMESARRLLANQVREDLGRDPVSDPVSAGVVQEVIWDYNDRDETTAEDVILALKRAAARDEG